MPPKKELTTKPPVKIDDMLILLAYLIIPTFTPNLMAFDTNAPKFLALAIVNLTGFILLFSNKQIRLNQGILSYFFKTNVGIVYTGFLAVSLLSFFNAINPGEALIQFSKIFTVFSAVFILSVILPHDLRYFRWIAIAFTTLLMIDSLSVFYYVNELIQGRIGSISDIKTIYSNKNMLASAIFVKLPFAVWLMIYEKNRLKIAGWIGLFLGFTATFFMAARAFYVGLIILTAIFMVYLLINYLFSKQKDLFRIAGFYLAALLLGLIIFSVTQQFLYPEIKTERYTESVGKQLATINTAESSVIARLEGWRWSWEMVKEKPILGVGSGNWKVNVLKYENQEHSIFTYLYKAHNDYLETLAETGLLGGLLYLGIFVLMAWALVQRIIKKESAGNNELYPFLFLAVSGLAFYSIDALFNFPADRPEIQIIFAFYLASGIAWMKYQEKKDLNDKSILQKKITNKWFRYIFLTVAITVAVASAYLLYLNFESSKLQRIAQQEILAGRLKSSANLFLQGFPSIPSVNINGEPIATLKGRYLINEGKYQEAIAVMRPDRSSPWDSRREYFMAMAFDNMGMTDSAAKYAERAYELKPFNYKHVKIYCLFLEQEGEYEKALSCLQKYLEVEKSNSEAWVFSSDLLTGQGKIDEAWKLIEQAKGILPQDSLIENQHKILYDLKFVGPNKKYFDEAMSYVNQGEYTKALSLIDKYIGAVPNDFTSHQQRAIILYYLKEYQSCIKEIDLSLTLKNNVGFLINLRGVCYYALNDLTSACKDFESASQLGIADGKTNYDRFCKEKLQ